MALVYGLGAYFVTGLIFSLVFFFGGYRAILHQAAGSKARVRLLWMPGAVAIWPVLLVLWATGRSNR